MGILRSVDRSGKTRNISSHRASMIAVVKPDGTRTLMSIRDWKIYLKTQKKS